jgi:hypothetical protein
MLVRFTESEIERLAVGADEMEGHVYASAE